MASFGCRQSRQGRPGGGGAVEYDYRIFKDNSKIKAEISDVRR
jgi:hypothetical protein